MKKTPFVLVALCGLAVTSAVQAQMATPGPPPKVLQIYREIVKPGHGPAHAKTEAGWPAAFEKASWPSHSLAMTSMSGPNEAWFMSAWDSFAAYEKDMLDIEKNSALDAEMARLSTVDGEHLSNMFLMFATYREDLSYRAPVSIPQMRYFQVVTYRVKPGRAADFVAGTKLSLANHDKLNLDEHWAMYQVVSGAPGGTYLQFIPMKSLADVDAGREMHGKAYDDAMGDENRKKMADLTNASIESTTSVIFRFSPKMSYPSKEWTMADPFWVRPAARPDAKVPAKKVN